MDARSTSAFGAVQEATEARQEDKSIAWMHALEVVREKALKECCAAVEQQANDDMYEAAYKSDTKTPADRKRAWIRAFDSTAEAWLYHMNPRTSEDYKYAIQRIKRPAVWSTREEEARVENADKFDELYDVIGGVSNGLAEVCTSIDLVANAIDSVAETLEKNKGE